MRESVLKCIEAILAKWCALPRGQASSMLKPLTMAPWFLYAVLIQGLQSACYPPSWGFADSRQLL